ncbi:membrane-associated PAP2 superfamily phosphatase [Pseudomonas psychrotolerans]|nr:membrane-associated PAP2 superfamily phosphatase [Pseudomonas psychrotolerans]
MKLSAVMISRICRLTEYSCCPWALVLRVIGGDGQGIALPGLLRQRQGREQQHSQPQQPAQGAPQAGR